MEQRRLRLGDILDDYCPRERRVTNHAVVAMIEEDVKQTRCTTCDAEHVYKGGKAPRRRKKDAGVVLYEEVLAGMPEAIESSVLPTAVRVESQPAASIEVQAMADGNVNGSQIDEPSHEQPDEAAPEAQRPVEEGPFHRRLIRATLPRPEGPERSAAGNRLHDPPEQRPGRAQPLPRRGRRVRRIRRIRRIKDARVWRRRERAGQWQRARQPAAGRRWTPFRRRRLRRGNPGHAVALVAAGPVAAALASVDRVLRLAQGAPGSGRVSR